MMKQVYRERAYLARDQTANRERAGRTVHVIKQENRERAGRTVHVIRQKKGSVQVELRT